MSSLRGAPMGYELIPPEGRCVDPDGHEQLRLMTYASWIPDEVLCPRCGVAWTIVVLPMPDTPRVSL